MNRCVLVHACALALFLAPLRARADVVVVREGFDAEILGKYLEVAYDPSGAATFDEVHAGKFAFARSTADVPSFGYRTGAEWARFRVDDRRVSPEERLVLEHVYAVTDELDIFACTADCTVHGFRRDRLGDHVPHRDWPEPTRLPTVRLGRGVREVYVRLSSGTSHQLSLVLRGETGWHRHVAAQAASHAAYAGALGAMFVYNALVWLAVGLPIYGRYVATLASTGVLIAGLNGMLFAALGALDAWWNDRLLLAAIAACGVTVIRFGLSLLELGALRKRFELGGRAISAAAVVAASSSVVVPVGGPTRALIALQVPLIALLVAAGVVAIRRGDPVGRWYLFAWSAFFGGVLVQAFAAAGVLPANGLTGNAIAMGSATEFLLLSFALAERIKRLQAEATANAELAARNARAAEQAGARALAEQERANAELRRLDARKDEFLANTSHELRTPLHGVMGMAEALHGAPELAPALRGTTTELLASARRLADLVGRLTELREVRAPGASRLEAAVGVAHAVGAAVADARLDAERKGLSLRVRVAPDAAAVLGGASALARVVRELVTNAVKVSDSGVIEVRARRSDERVELTVTDEGCGIPAEQIPSIFFGFEQIDGGATRQRGGVGLGLALAKALVEQMGGTLTLESVVGVGTVASVSLAATDAVPEVDASEVPTTPDAARPVAEVRAPDAAPAVDAQATAMAYREAPAEPETRRVAERPSATVRAARVPSLVPPASPGRGSTPRPARILVVDDDRVNRMVIAEHLRDTVFERIEAGTGAEALEAFRTQGPFDAVLLDVMMPGMDGYAVCRELRKSAGATELPVLLLTAKTQLADLIAGFDVGANDYVRKPIAKGELIARVTAHVGLARASLAMRRFVPREAIRLLGHEDLTDVVLGDAVSQELTIAFSDVRGFTTAIENASPAQAFEWLNRTYGVVGPAVREHGGFVDKYIGDAVMAVFPGATSQALAATVAMHRGLAALGGLRMGTGIHVGPTMLGTLGEPERFEATVLSDAVNVASRVEGACKVFGARALATREVVNAAAGARFSWRSLGRVAVKGRAAPIELFELLDADPDDERAGKLELRDAFEMGVEAFARGAVRESLMHFQRVLDEHPLDGAAFAYFVYVSGVLASDDAPRDGVMTLNEK